ncbi:MAG: hypothetical protein JWN96_3655 [Mycobacterium sp.]|jgi:hypothetical protein|nr:hypothetical protein [Mycobacterium sp.]
MMTVEQARLACVAMQQEAEAKADRQRLINAIRLQRRARRQAERAQRATRRAATAAAQASLAWSRS